MAAIAKTFAELLGKYLAPYLAKYLPLTGGTLTGPLGIKASGGTCQFKMENTGSDYSYVIAGVNLAFITGGKSVSISNAGLVLTSSAVISWSGSVDLGSVSSRWPNLYGKNANLSGDLTVSGKINGVSAASLITAEDLVEVLGLSVEQSKKLSAKVTQRALAVQAEQQRILTEEANKSQSIKENMEDMQHPDNQTIMGGYNTICYFRLSLCRDSHEERRAA